MSLNRRPQLGTMSAAMPLHCLQSCMVPSFTTPPPRCCRRPPQVATMSAAEASALIEALSSVDVFDKPLYASVAALVKVGRRLLACYLRIACW